MKITVLTLGCKTNQAESNYIENAIASSGHSLVAVKDFPDICIINTCTVTSKSDYQCRQLIRRALKTSTEVVVTGCYSEISEAEIRAISPDIKIVKNNEKNRIINRLDINNKSITRDFFTKRARPLVKIQEGCNYSCSYCAIPAARGRSRSRPRRDIIKEILLLEGKGFKEAVLTGTHIGHYGHDFEPKESLSLLVEDILKRTEKIRIRLSSIEVNEIDPRLIGLLLEERLCPHLHIPLQSGDDRILKLMKRPYNIENFILKLNKILETFQGVSLGADVIVGFPGEGDLEFRNTRKLLEEMPFTYLHIFPYSKRPGTVASQMASNMISAEVKRGRSEVLREIDRYKREAYKKSQIGRTLKVIREKEIDKGLFIGKSENYLNVYFNMPGSLKADAIDVKIFKTFQDGIAGIPIKEMQLLDS